MDRVASHLGVRVVSFVRVVWDRVAVRLVSRACVRV